DGATFHTPLDQSLKLITHCLTGRFIKTSIKLNPRTAHRIPEQYFRLEPRRRNLFLLEILGRPIQKPAQRPCLTTHAQRLLPQAKLGPGNTQKPRNSSYFSMVFLSAG